MNFSNAFSSTAQFVTPKGAAAAAHAALGRKHISTAEVRKQYSRGELKGYVVSLGFDDGLTYDMSEDFVEELFR